MRAAQTAAAPALRRLECALVVGGGGALGSALLGEALVAGRFQRVAAVITAPLASTVRGFDPLPVAALQAGDARGAEVAFVVFERTRHSNGRDDAFLQPVPEDLLPIATALRAGGVRRLVVVVPHAPALLPQALKAGFASEDEGAVAALGFEHLVFLRAAQAGTAAVGGSRLQRFAAWWLGQLVLMVPTREQPVRAVQLAALVVQLARLLPSATPGTRVVPQELLWQASQADAEAVLGAWLAPP